MKKFFVIVLVSVLGIGAISAQQVAKGNQNAECPGNKFGFQLYQLLF